MTNLETKSLEGIDAIKELMTDGFKLLEEKLEHMSAKVEVLEAKEIELKAKIDMLISELKSTIKIDRNDDKIDDIECKKCDNTFESRENLKEHMKTKHRKSYPIKQQDERLKCDKCEYSCIDKSDMRKHIVDKHPKCIQPKKCKMCEKTFTKNVELERHIKIHHEAEPFECEKCGKTFVLKWRLRKHLSVHETRIYCHYFNNDKECPFEEIGCKFKHNISPPCKSEGCNNLLCQYRHSYSSVSFMQKTDVFDKENSFFTSTPKRQRLQSEKCDEKSQCEECYVDRYIQKFQEDNMISPKEILMPHLLAT